jgi:protein SCO1/2
MCCRILLLITACLAGGCRAREFNAASLAGPQISPPLPKPDLILRNTDGSVFDLKKETEGYVTLLFFGYTHCPDVCPVHLANIAAAMKDLDSSAADRIKVVFVTVDPKRDTPGVIRNWLDKFDPRFIGLTGDSASIAWAFTQLRLGHAMDSPVQADSGLYTIAHTALVLAFTRDDLAHVAYPFGIPRDAWANDLKLLARGG